MTITFKVRRTNNEPLDKEWAPVQDTIIKRRPRKQPDQRKDKEEIIEFLADIKSGLDVIYGELLQGEDLFVKKKRGAYRSKWIHIIESMQHDIDMFAMDVKEYGVTKEKT